MILAGDIGGTKTRLALFEPTSLRLLALETYASADFPHFEAVLSAFRKSHPQAPAVAALGVAGPVREGTVVTTVRAWPLDARGLGHMLGGIPVRLLNDLEANAGGIAALGTQDFAVLQPGRPYAGNAALIAAGTGLGEAGLYWDGAAYHPFACEGGHVDFAPLEDEDVELWRYLRARLGRVSYERVLSGPGLLGIFEFLRAVKGMTVEPWLDLAIRTDDGPAAIAEGALNRRSPVAGRAVEMFVRLYGAEAGNLALKTNAVSGLFVGGGIAPKLLEALTWGGFLKAFNDKGRMRPLMEAIPVKVILNDKAALLGAARAAKLLLA